MKVLVTGSNGLLGQKLTRLLQEDDTISLIATGRRSSVLPLPHCPFELLDITDAHAVMRIFAKHKPDVVIHTAAMTNVDQCEKDREGCIRTNVQAVEHLVRACEEYRVRLLHISTDFVFDGSHGPLDESEQPSPVNFYGESKALGEKIVRESTLDWAIIRTVLVYGITRDMSRSNIVLWVKENLEQRKAINVVNDQWRTPTLAEDLAIGCYLVLKRNASGIYHISGEDGLSPYDIAVLSAEYFGLDQSLITPVDSSFFNQAAKRPARTGFKVDKARRELGYKPRSFKEGLEILAGQIANPDLA